MTTQNQGDIGFQALVARYLAAVPDRVTAMRAGLAEDSLDSTRTLAHQLRGSGGGYGFPGLSEKAADVEQACLDQLDLAAVTQRVDALEAELQAILAEQRPATSDQCPAGMA